MAINIINCFQPTWILAISSTLLLSIIPRSSTVHPGCQRGLFQCDNFRCIAPEWKCDGADDCGDNSDEHSALCPSALKNCHNKFTCANKEACISKEYVCDSHPDCSDGSDETGCVPSVRCKDNEHMCDDGVTCIVEHHLCDHVQDCPDNSDESNCPSENKNRCDISNKKFLCGDRKKCIDITKVCDNRVDCEDQSDEGSACSSICSDSDCTHECYPTPQTAICTCPDGYKLLADNATCQDVDECQRMPEKPCSQICVNNPGSFYCRCNSDYRLSENGRECTVDSSVEPILLLAKKNEIRKLYMKSKKYELLVDELEDVVDIAYDAYDNMVFWIDGVENKVYSANINGYFLSKTPIVSVGLIKPEKIAVDWISRKVYIADSGRKEILACEITMRECVVVVKNLNMVKDIALHPSKRTMYWIDWGETSKIFTAGMDGKNEKIFVEVKSGKPISLVIDYVTDVLYWVDLLYQEVEYIKLDGTDRKILLSSLIQKKPSTIALFEDNIIWSHKGSRGSIMSADKFSGKSKTTLIEQARNTQLIVIAHPVTQPQEINVCSVSPCSDVCLLSSQTPGYSCACPEHLILGGDGASCKSKPDSVHIIAATKSKIIKISSEFIGVKPDEKVFVSNLYHVTNLQLDEITKDLFYIEDKTEIYYVPTEVFGKANPKLVLDEGFTANSLSVDWFGKNVFLTDGMKRTVEVVRMDGTARVVIQRHHREKPRSVLVDPLSGYMYISYVGNASMIEKCKMDGSDCFILYEMAGAALSLTLDDNRKRLYWIDDKTGHIESICPMTGKRRRVHTRNYSNPPHSFAVHDDLLYWSGKLQPIVYVMNVSDRTTQSRVFLHDLSDPPLLTILHNKVIDDSENRCGGDNSGCQYICLTLPEGQRSCKCPNGLYLARDGTSCVKNPNSLQCLSSELMCESKDQCFSRQDKCDGHIDCYDGTDEDNCPHASCDADEFICDNGQECYHQMYRCDEDFDCTDLSDEKNCSCRVLGKFQCDSGDCVGLSDVCDYHQDCEDGSDENDKTCKRQEVCDSDDFKCDDGTCIEKSQKCDAHYDCKDKSDETDCPILLQRCTSNQIQCMSDGTCLPKSMWCNRIPDCQDGSDETDCPVIITAKLCSWPSFRCDNGECVPGTYRCNKVKDCGDGSDEKNCRPIIKVCDNHSFTCKSGQCVQSEYRCNGVKDCTDGSDEEFCPTTTVRCNLDQIQCVNGTCLPISLKCDGKPDCIDWTDERNCPPVTRPPVQPVIKQPYLIQVRTPASEIFTTRGPEISSNLVPIMETHTASFPVNECYMNIKSCSQKCEDRMSGYHCYCAPGYKMDDKMSCVSPGGAVYMIVSSNNHIRFSTLNGSFLKNAREDDSFGRITSLDFHANMQIIYWADNMNKIFSFKMNTMETTEVSKKFGSVEGIAVDWVGNNVYISQGQRQRISVCAMKDDLKYCVPVVKNGLAAPRSIAVHPTRGLMFWSDVGYQKKIECSWMDGRKRQTIVDDLLWPNGLTVDVAADLIFWTDGHRDIIEGARLDGSQRFTVKKRESFQPYAISVFEDNLYFSNWKADTLERVNKFGYDNVTKLENLFQPTSIKIYSALLQPAPDGINRCSQIACDQICLLSPLAAECVCGHGYIQGTTSGKTKCQKLKVKMCTRTHCQNDGVCTKTRGIEHCRCTPGFYGKFCEKRIEKSTPMVIQSTTAKTLPETKVLPDSTETVTLDKGSDKNDKTPATMKDKEPEPRKHLWLIGFFLCIIIAVGGMGLLYYLRRKRQMHRFNRLIHYCSPSKSEEAVDLVSDNIAFGNPNFQDYDDINGNMTYKKFTDQDDTDSNDSAFSSHYGNTTRESNRI